MSQSTNINDLPPVYQTSDQHNHDHRSPIRSERSQTIIKSARYPRVAVLLGISKRWYIPLLLCRSLSIGFSVWWAVVTGLNILSLLVWHLENGQGAHGKGGDSLTVDRNLDCEKANNLGLILAVTQLALAYLWAFTAAYLSHLFASSLMSRWLQYYSPLAVLVRLCSLSILFSYGLAQAFVQLGAMTIDRKLSLVDNLNHLSIGLPLWLCVSIAVLVVYFLTQQDISIESDRDDRKRRMILRFKCLVAIAGASLSSLLILLMIIRLGNTEVLCNASVSLSRLFDQWNDISTKVFHIQRSEL